MGIIKNYAKDKELVLIVGNKIILENKLNVSLKLIYNLDSNTLIGRLVDGKITYYNKAISLDKLRALNYRVAYITLAERELLKKLVWWVSENWDETPSSGCH